MLELIQTIALCVIATILVVQSEASKKILRRIRTVTNRMNLMFRLRTARNKVRLFFKK